MVMVYKKEGYKIIAKDCILLVCAVESKKSVMFSTFLAFVIKTRRKVFEVVFLILRLRRFS